MTLDTPSGDLLVGKQEEPFVPAIAYRRAAVNGWVYFILGEDTGRCKIGHARDVERRLRGFQTGSSEELTIYGVIPAVNPFAMEKAIHKRFAELRIRGEWFTITDELIGFVDMYGYELEGTHRIWEEAYGPPVPRLPPAYRL